jgi:CRP-like cAMP-binding protein
MLDFERKRLEELQSQLKHVSESRYLIVKKPGKNVPMFIEVVRIGAGKTFGEQALLKNNEPMVRAATIKTTKDCHFAVMSKDDFQNILKGKIKKSKLEQMDVLQHHPFFRVWTKTQLLKLVNFIIEPKQFIRNQVVYREGDRAENIYIIRSGDFEVSRRY